MSVEPNAQMQLLREKITKALVDEPDQVVVRPLDGQQGTRLQLSVAANDLGKIIGKQGRTAHCIRSILSAASAKLNKRYSLEIME